MRLEVRGIKHLSAARPVLTAVLVVMGVLSLVAVIGGVAAIIWNATSPTNFTLLGATLSTGHVGVAFAGMGLLCMLFVVRAVLNNIRHLATLPPDREES